MLYLLTGIIGIFFTYQLLDFIVISLKDFFKYKVTLQEFLQRIYNPSLPKVDTLLYGVSCGETAALKPIVKYLSQRNEKYILCTHTISSYRMHKFTNFFILLPFDNILTMFLFFYKLNPSTIFICERDLKPIFLFYALLFRCKINFVNYKIKNSFLNRISNKIHYIIANNIYLTEGPNSRKYKNFGNLKWLSANNYNNPKFKQTTIIIASANKEEIDIHINLIKNINNCRIIYVPRYLNWENELISKLSNLNYNWITTDISSIENHHINIIWSYGLLNYLYSKSHICIMGNTFYNPKKGGHNLVEPAINCNAIILGPDYITCKDLADKLCIVYAKDEKDLIKKTKVLISLETYFNLGNQNKNIVLENQKNIYSNIKKFI